MPALDLPDDIAALKQFIADREAVIADQRQHIAQLEERNRLLQAILYGAKSEKRPVAAPDQHHLFDEAERVAEAAEPTSFEQVFVPAHARGRGGRKPIPADLPRVEVVHDIPEADKVCACGHALTRMGEEVSEKLDIVPAKVQVLRHVRPKYAYRACEGTADDGPTVKTAPMPPQLIPQGIVSAGTVAHVIVAKYADGLPLYRQEQQLARLGVDISRGTLAGWVVRAARACAPLMELLLAEVRAGPVINLDETPVQVLNEPGRANTTKSYMWVARGGPPKAPAVIFRYSPSRAGSVASELIGDFQGVLQTDGYAGYNALGEREGIVHAGCWAHVRRKFVDIQKAGGQRGTSQEVLDHIAALYAVEKKAREAKVDAERLGQLRQERSAPIVSRIKALLDARMVTTPPKSLLGKAIAYALGQWPRLTVFLENGLVAPDNNAAENSIRPFAVGRKNWLFSGHPNGADASATLYSLVESAKVAGLEPYAYLRQVFEQLPLAVSADDIRALLPRNVAIHSA